MKATKTAKHTCGGRSIKGRIRLNSREGRGDRIFAAAVTISAMLAGILAAGAAVIGF